MKFMSDFHAEIARSRAGIDFAPDYSHGRPESNGGLGRILEKKGEDVEQSRRRPLVRVGLWSRTPRNGAFTPPPSLV